MQNTKTSSILRTCHGSQQALLLRLLQADIISSRVCSGGGLLGSGATSVPHRPVGDANYTPAHAHGSGTEARSGEKYRNVQFVHRFTLCLLGT